MKDRFGLRELPKKKLLDQPDYNLGFVYAIPKDIPEEFCLEKRKVKSQGDTDMCASYASCLASEYQEEVELYPPYTFALSKQNDPESWGQNLRQIHATHQRYGAVETGKTSVNSRYIADYPDLTKEASIHRKQSYFKVNYDDIRGFIYKYKQPVVIGVMWSWELNEKYLSGVVEEGYGHAIVIIGFSKDYLIIQNSYGEEAGEKGLHYLANDTAKHFIGRYGAFAMTDLPKEVAKEQNARAEWHYANRFNKLRIFLRKLVL